MSLSRVQIAIGITISSLTFIGGAMKLGYDYHESMTTDKEAQEREDLLRRDMNLNFIDLRIRDVQADMRPFEEKGIKKLNDREEKKYERLQRKLEGFEKTRTKLSGFDGG